MQPRLTILFIGHPKSDEIVRLKKEKLQKNEVRFEKNQSPVVIWKMNAHIVRGIFLDLVQDLSSEYPLRSCGCYTDVN